MRTVTIACGACQTVVEWFDSLCPICRTVVKAGKQHHCRLTPTLDVVAITGCKATVEVWKGAK